MKQKITPEATPESVEKAAENYAEYNYARAPLQSEDDANYIKDVSMYSFIAGAKWAGQATPGIETLLAFLAQYGGEIVSTAKLTPEWINQARASGRLYVDENSLGYVWEPDIDGFPTTEQEVEAFERWYPLPVEMPEKLKNPDWLFKKPATPVSIEQAAKNEYKNIPDEYTRWQFESAFIKGAKFMNQECSVSSLEADNLTPHQAKCILKLRDALSLNDFNEAYHWLYQIASPLFDKFEPWEDIKKIAAATPVKRFTTAFLFESKRGEWVDSDSYKEVGKILDECLPLPATPAIDKSNEAIEHCNVCGGKMATIRGRYPKDEDRKVCPTCAVEKLEAIESNNWRLTKLTDE